MNADAFFLKVDTEWIKELSIEETTTNKSMSFLRLRIPTDTDTECRQRQRVLSRPTVGPLESVIAKALNNSLRCGLSPLRSSCSSSTTAATDSQSMFAMRAPTQRLKCA